MFNDANEVVDELLESLYSRYQGNLETSIRGSDFIFDSSQIIYYKCHKVDFKHWGVIHWFFRLGKKEKSNKNPKHEDDVFNMQWQLH